jgi:hypothetical protein
MEEESSAVAKKRTHPLITGLLGVSMLRKKMGLVVGPEGLDNGRGVLMRASYKVLDIQRNISKLLQD